MTDTPLLSIYNPVANIGGRVLFSFEEIILSQSSCTFIMLPSGAGKSVLASLLAGLIPDNIHLHVSGQARFGDGPQVEIPDAYWQDSSYLVPQNFYRYILELRVSDELLSPLENRNVPYTVARDRMFKAATALGIQNLLERNPLTLSGGEVQRLAIATALCANPILLVLDDPFAELDPDICRDLEQLLFVDVPRIGITTCIVSSLPPSSLPHSVKLIDPHMMQTGVATRLPPVFAQSDNRQPLLQVIELTFRYPRQERPALSDLNFSLTTGQTVALTGPNGAGKSTLLAILLGFERIRSGRIIVDGKFQQSAASSSLRLRSGVVFQSYHHILFGTTPREELQLALSIRDRRGAASLAYPVNNVNEILERFTLESVANLVVDEISNQSRRLLAVASALVQASDIIILDEPTAGLDVRGRALLLNELSRIRREDVLIIVVSHDRSFLRALSPMELCLEDGKLQYFGTFNTRSSALDDQP